MTASELRILFSKINHMFILYILNLVVDVLEKKKKKYYNDKRFLHVPCSVVEHIGLFVVAAQPLGSNRIRAHMHLQRLKVFHSIRDGYRSVSS